ncbi:TorF family putative porin [Herminiimonas arsenitoxidans]|uniref:TorF family putative porin n=1 Tax=Herminiimonas arsenitoxidans TaxID=1809410 RepID=UPI00097030F2|nr:TorF family putative porin [Herminiimonas arsenitoxidans]
MKKLIIAVAVMGAFAGSMAHAEDAVPEHSFTGNLSVVSDYRFRGVSQTFKQPAVQGGFDYAHSSGFYVGNWNSNVSGNSFTDGSIEMDLYGGYKFTIAPDLTGDVGVLYYYYPGAFNTGTNKKYNTTELYAAGTYKWFTLKYSSTVSDFFATPDSKGSGYLELNAAFEVADKTTLGFHVGQQKVRHNGSLDYTDYKVSLARDFGFATIGLAIIGTDVDGDGPVTSGSGKVKKTAGTTGVLSISKAF